MKLLALLLVFIFISVAYSKREKAIRNQSIVVRKLEPNGSETLEEWVRVTKDQDVLGVSATKTTHPKWSWEIFISAAEFVREEPLESLLIHRITKALEKMNGVTEVHHEDREVWIIAGDVNGEALVRAAAAAVDTLAPRIRMCIDSLEE